VTRREVPVDAGEILAALARNEVAFVVIGGLAVQAHGHPRTTQDIDLVPDLDRENLARLAAALTELGARPAGSPAAPVDWRIDADSLAEGVTSLDTDAGGVDVHPAPPGVKSFAALRAGALEIEVRGLRLAVAGRDDLIAMKRASALPIDRGDIAALTEPG